MNPEQQLAFLDKFGSFTEKTRKAIILNGAQLLNLKVLPSFNVKNLLAGFVDIIPYLQGFDGDDDALWDLLRWLQTPV